MLTDLAIIMSLTQRQSEILKAIIEEYIGTAQPVASVELVQKRGFNVSGATVRNIMSDLVKRGYLQMPHVSAGRVPTESAYRYYLTYLLQEEDISVLDEVSLKQKIWNARYELERLLTNAASALSEATNSMGFALTSDGFITYAGTSRLLDIPEFFEINVTRAVFRFVDDYNLAYSILDKTKNTSKISVLIGKEIGLANMDPVCLISTHCEVGDKTCYAAVLGPSRLEYERVLPIVRHMSHLLNEVSESL